jgi:hypothetical protein
MPQPSGVLPAISLSDFLEGRLARVAAINPSIARYSETGERCCSFPQEKYAHSSCCRRQRL